MQAYDFSWLTASMFRLGIRAALLLLLLHRREGPDAWLLPSQWCWLECSAHGGLSGWKLGQTEICVRGLPRAKAERASSTTKPQGNEVYMSKSQVFTRGATKRNLQAARSTNTTQEPVLRRHSRQVKLATRWPAPLGLPRCLRIAKCLGQFGEPKRSCRFAPYNKLV